MSKPLHHRVELAKVNLNSWVQNHGYMDSVQVRREMEILKKNGEGISEYYAEFGRRGLKALDDWDFDRVVGNYTPADITADDIAETK